MKQRRRRAEVLGTKKVDGMVESRGKHVREVAWSMAGASVGALLRRWVGETWAGAEGVLLPALVLATTAATLIGFAVVASIRQPIKTVLFTAGGAAGSISATATRAASATPVQSLIGVAGYFAGAVVGFLVGMLVAFSVGNLERKERR